MQLPHLDSDTHFEELLQDLPPETIEMAYEFKAFSRSRKIKTPRQLLRVVLLYCGLDQSQRQIAGNLALLGTHLTDSAISARLEACHPWIKVLLPKMLHAHELPTVCTGQRIIVIDGSTVQSPGAKGIQYRLHIGLDLVSLELSHLLISDAKTGKTPKASTIYLAGWVLVWTSLSPDVLDADAVMSLYRARWQVELAIKRWKSILDADALRARYGSPLAERPMRHQLQRLPEAVCQLLYWRDPREEQCCEPL